MTHRVRELAAGSGGAVVAELRQRGKLALLLSRHGALAVHPLLPPPKYSIVCVSVLLRQRQRDGSQKAAYQPETWCRAMRGW